MFQSFAVEAFHRKECMSVFLANLVDRADVRMIQSRSSPCFPPKSFQRLRVRRKFIRQKLQRHEPTEVRVLSLIHHAHSAAAQPFHDAVMRKSFAYERIGRFHVPHILGRARRQVNERGDSEFLSAEWDLVAASTAWTMAQLAQSVSPPAQASAAQQTPPSALPSPLIPAPPRPPEAPYPAHP